MLTRQEFINLRNSMTPNFGDENSPLWEVEKSYQFRSEWFIFARLNDPSDDYWDWCCATLKRAPLCYISDYNGEWWGFEFEDDATIWYLKWI